MAARFLLALRPGGTSGRVFDGTVGSTQSPRMGWGLWTVSVCVMQFVATLCCAPLWSVVVLDVEALECRSDKVIKLKRSVSGRANA